MNQRIIQHSIVKGVFGLPMGIRFLSREIFDHPSRVEVSTVCLEGAHMEDSLKICEPEHGYETMVFLDGCSFFSVFTASYATYAEAEAGHVSTINKLLTGELPLAVPLAHYHAWEEVADHEQTVSR